MLFYIIGLLIQNASQKEESQEQGSKMDIQEMQAHTALETSDGGSDRAHNPIGQRFPKGSQLPAS